MSRLKRILIVSASAGSGHVRAADALRNGIQTAYPDCRVEHLDVLSLAPRWVKTAYGGGFELIASHAPRVWGELYRWADGPAEDQARWGAIAERTLFRAFRRVLQSGDWDACVCTHFLPAQLAAGRPGMPPFSLVVTDFALHRYWVQPRVRRYFVATEPMAAEVRTRLPQASAKVTGIPVDPGFRPALDREGLRHELGLDANKPVVVVVGGGLGIGVEENTHGVLESGCDVRVIAICGRNTSARDRLSALTDRRLITKGYVETIERCFAAADVIVTKPGGLTVSEALAAGKPLVLTQGMPGHETQNREEMLRLGAAVAVDSDVQLARAIRELFRENGRIAELSRNARRHGRPDAGVRIAGLLSDELHAQAAA